MSGTVWEEIPPSALVEAGTLGEILRAASDMEVCLATPGWAVEPRKSLSVNHQNEEEAGCQLWGEGGL